MSHSIGSSAFDKLYNDFNVEWCHYDDNYCRAYYFVQLNCCSGKLIQTSPMSTVLFSQSLHLGWICSKMIPPQIERLLVFFDVFGFNSGLSKISRNRGAYYFVEFVHVSVAISLTFFKFYLLVEFFPQQDLGVAISESLQYFCALYTYWLIIIESFYYRRVHQMFWDIFQHIDVHFHNQAQLRLRNYLLKFIELFTVTLSFFLVFSILNNFFNFGVSVIYAFIIKICQVRIFYYIFCLEVTQFQLQVIEHKVEAIKSRSTGMLRSIYAIDNDWKECRFFQTVCSNSNGFVNIFIMFVAWPNAWMKCLVGLISLPFCSAIISFLRILHGAILPALTFHCGNKLVIMEL